MARTPESVFYKVVPMGEVTKYHPGSWIIVRQLFMGPGPRGGKRFWLNDPNWHNPGFTDELKAEAAANDLQEQEQDKIPAFLPKVGPRP